MKALLAGLGATICLGVATSAALADPPPQAPDSAPGNYPNPMGNCCPCPSFAPFNGVPPQPMPQFMGNCGGPRKSFFGFSKGPGGPGMGPGGPGMYPGGPGMGGMGPGGPGAGGGVGSPQTIAAFPTHPYARGPRDYFMQD